MQFNISALLVFALAADALIQYPTTQYTNTPHRVVVEQQKVHTAAPRITNVSISAQKANLKVVPRRRDRMVASLRNGKDKALVHIGNHKALYGAAAGFIGGVSLMLLIGDHLTAQLKRLEVRARLLFSNMGKSIASFAETVGTFVSECTQAFFRHIDWLMGKMGLKKVSEFNRRMWDGFKAQVIRAWKAIKSVGNNGIDAAKSALGLASSSVQERLQQVRSSVAGATQNLAEKTFDVADHIGDSAEDIKKSAEAKKEIAKEKTQEFEADMDARKDAVLKEAEEGLKHVTGQVKKETGKATSAAAGAVAAAAEKARNEAEKAEQTGENLKEAGEDELDKK